MADTSQGKADTEASAAVRVLHEPTLMRRGDATTSSRNST